MTTIPAPGPTMPAARLWCRISAAAAAATVLSQIVWVLVGEELRDAVTVATVVLFATASLSHAIATRGPRWAARFAVIAITVGWTAEALGTTTGWPFGSYDYADSLGAKLGPVPLVIPLAWLMMAYPVLLAARRVTARASLQTLYAAGLLTAWDLFLDPQMVAEGHWVWQDADALALPGIPGIPVQNYAGWFLVGLLLFAAAAALLPDDGAHDDRVPAGLLLWVLLSNAMANAVFWGRPAVALLGGLAMGLLLLPWLRSGILERGFWVRA